MHYKITPSKKQDTRRTVKQKNYSLFSSTHNQEKNQTPTLHPNENYEQFHSYSHTFQQLFRHLDCRHFD
jgi:hypothetical protein